MTDNKNMKSNDWTSQLNQRLADHQEPAPEGLWDRIEAQLDADIPQQPAIVPVSHRSTLRRWMAAVGKCYALINHRAVFNIAQNHHCIPFLTPSGSAFSSRNRD